MTTTRNFAMAWIGREFHSPSGEDSATYLFLERPTKGFYNGAFYFWHVSDPSLKIRLPAGAAVHLKIARGDLHPILQRIDGVKR